MLVLQVAIIWLILVAWGAAQYRELVQLQQCRAGPIQAAGEHGRYGRLRYSADADGMSRAGHVVKDR